MGKLANASVSGARENPQWSLTGGFSEGLEGAVKYTSVQCISLCVHQFSALTTNAFLFTIIAMLFCTVIFYQFRLGHHCLKKDENVHLKLDFPLQECTAIVC